jgi:enoyl-CoA hydratase/carnithine racemase
MVPPDRVKELSWSARVLGSEEAYALGMVTAVVDDPLTSSREMAACCAAKSPDAIRGIKALVNQGWQLSEAEALALEARLQGAVIGRPNQVEAVAANLGKREPRFND